MSELSLSCLVVWRTHEYTQTQVHTHTYVRTYVQTDRQTDVRWLVSSHSLTQTHAQHTRTHTHIRIIYLIYLSVYLNTHTHTHGHTHTHTHGHTPYQARTHTRTHTKHLTYTHTLCPHTDFHLHNDATCRLRVSLIAKENHVTYDRRQATVDLGVTFISLTWIRTLDLDQVKACFFSCKHKHYRILCITGT